MPTTTTLADGQQQLDNRKLRGEQAINVHPDYPCGIDTETAAADIVSDVLTFLFGPAGAHRIGPQYANGHEVKPDEYALNEARRFIERAMRSYEGDMEDYTAAD